MKKSSFKETVVGFNAISAIGLMLLFRNLSDSASYAAVAVPSILLCLFGLVTIVLNVIYITTRPTRGLIKTVAILVSILILFGICIAIAALLRQSS